MTLYHFGAEPSWHFPWCFSTMVQHVSEVELCTFGLLLPPLSQGGHIVCEDSGNAAIGVGLQVGKELSVGFGHRLNLQCEDAQPFQHGLHTLWYHAQILGANEHVSGLHQYRKHLHGMFLPQMIVPLMVVVLVDAAECLLLFIGKRTEGRFSESFNARMIMAHFLFVGDEEHLAGEPHESLAQMGAHVGSVIWKAVIYLPLCSPFGAQTVECIGLSGETMFPHPCCLCAKEAVYERIGDVWFCQQSRVDVESHAFYLLTAHGQ